MSHYHDEAIAEEKPWEGCVKAFGEACYSSLCRYQHILEMLGMEREAAHTETLRFSKHIFTCLGKTSRRHFHYMTAACERMVE